jgi:transposase InsO family protein
MVMLRKNLLDKIIAKQIKIKDVAFLLDVERETVSRWLAKYRFEGLDGIMPKKPGPKNGTAHNRSNEDIENLVIQIGKLNPYKGPLWIADQIQNIVDQSTVYRILKRKNVRYGPYYSHKRRKKKSYCLDTPGRELQLDVCFPFGRTRREVVYDAIDDCSRWVFAKVMPKDDAFQTIAFLEELIQKSPFTIQAVRTDQGREFGKQVTQWLKLNGIEHRKNPPYTPQHNGKIERYHRTFKENAAVSWPAQAEPDDLNYLLTLWLKEYNFNMKHGGLGMNRLTPAEKLLFSLDQTFCQSHLKNVTGTLQLYNL